MCYWSCEIRYVCSCYAAKLQNTDNIVICMHVGTSISSILIPSSKHLNTSSLSC